MLFFQLINFDGVAPTIAKRIRSDLRAPLAQGYRWVEWHENINTIVPSPDLSLVYAKDLGWRELVSKVAQAKSLNVILLGNTTCTLALPFFEGDFDIRSLNAFMQGQVRHAPSPRKKNSQSKWTETVPLPLSSIKTMIMT